MTSTTPEKENDKLESIRRHMTEYGTILGDMEIVYNDYKEDTDERYVKYVNNQTENIRRLAKKLEDSGHPLEKICAKVSRDVEKYDIDSRHVRMVLEDKYKQLKHANKSLEIQERYQNASGSISASGIVTNQAQNDEIAELEQEQEQEIKKPILLSNDGSVIPDSESPTTKETIDFHELKKQADQEIREDKGEQLDYSSSSSLSPKQIHKLNQKIQLIQKLEAENQQLREDWQFEVERNKKGLSDKIKVADTIVLQENENLKKEVRSLKTKLEEVDKQVVIEGDPLLRGYKEIEIFKLDSTRVTWLLKTSKDSERTVFLLANPKTMEILHVKTDKEMHRIQRRREYELEEEQEEGQEEKEEVE